MASQNPPTPVKVPAGAANYTPATLDPDLRSQLNMLLIKEGIVFKIQDQLLHSLNSNGANWPTLVQNHALALLRSGEITSFPALLKRVIEDVRHDTALAPAATNGASAEVNGKKSATSTPTADGGSNGTSTSSHSLAVPQEVVAEALRMTREGLETVCELDQNGAT